MFPIFHLERSTKTPEVSTCYYTGGCIFNLPEAKALNGIRILSKTMMETNRNADLEAWPALI